MDDSNANRSGFLDALEGIGPGDHVCLIYETQEEQLAATIRFMRIGLERGEKCVYIADDDTAGAVLDAMRADGMEVDSALQSGALSVLSWRETYLREDRFHPDGMISLLTEATKAATEAGFSALRVAGDMTWGLGGDPGVGRLMEYEAKLNYFFQGHGCLAMCQYNRKRFSPGITLDVIRTHPILIYGNMVCRNFYYIPPDEFLRSRQPWAEVERLLSNIKDREEAEKERQGRNELLEKLFATTHFSVAYMDTDFNFIRVNRAYAAADDREPGSLIGRNHFDVYPSVENKSIFQRVVETGEPYIAHAKPFEYTEHPERGITYWDWTLHPVKDTSGSVEGLLLCLVNVTERVRAEEELRKQRERLEDVVKERTADLQKEITERKQAEEALRRSERELAVKNRIADVFLTVSDDEMYSEVLRIILEALESEYGVLGYIDEHGNMVAPSLTRDIWEQCQIADKAIVFPRETWGGIWGRAMIEKRALYSNEPLSVPEGHVPIQRALSVPILHQGELIGILVIANRATEYNEEDVRLLERIAGRVAPVLDARLQRDRHEAERKRAEERITGQNRFLNTVLESLTYPFLVVDAGDYSVPTANSAAGFDSSRVGKTCYAISHGQDKPCSGPYHTCPLEEVKRTRKPVTVEHIHYDQHGNERVVEVHAYPVFDKEKRVVQVIEYYWDITERRRSEETLKRQAQELARSNAELEQFAYLASHDLQEPLLKIRAFGNRLKAKCAEELGDRGRDYLERMQNAANRMQALIHDLLTFSRVTTHAKPFQPVDLNEVVEGVVSDLETRIGQTGGRVEVGDLPIIDADPTQMRQLFQNLISNALKYRRPEVAPLVKVHSQIRFKQEVPDTWQNGVLCEITIEDNGIGFDEKYLDRIFEVFQRLHGRAEYEGTGVGLALCRKIVERHWGTITARSGPGQGATFTVTLPTKQPKEESASGG